MTTSINYRKVVVGLFVAGALVLGLSVQAAPPECSRVADNDPNRTLEEWRACGKARVDMRVADLGALNVKIQQMTRVSAEVRSTLSGAINNQVLNLTTLGTLIQKTDTKEAVRPLVQSIPLDYRIYMLFNPQVRITATADKAMTVTILLTELHTKLKAAVDAAEAQNMDVSNMRANLEKMSGNISNAQLRTSAAVNAVKDLTPDGGDTAKKDANLQALTSARAALDEAAALITGARNNAEAVRVELGSSNTARVSFTAKPTSGVAPLSVDFALVNGADGIMYQIQFGDGATADIRAGGGVLSNVTHVYPQPGAYTAKLRDTARTCALIDCDVLARVVITVAGYR